MLIKFPAPGYQVLSCLVYLFGLSILAHCLSRRVLSEGVTGFRSLTQISWPRLCIILVFFDSWLYLFSSSLIIFGIGLETSLFVCATGIYLCAVFYCSSKVLIYLFLLEKVHLVWTPAGKAKRLRSPLYIFCLTSVLVYVAVVIVMFIGRVHHLRQPDGACIIGLKVFSSIFLLSYDLYINVLLTSLFLFPLLASRLSNPRVKGVAIRTVFAAGVALTTSTVNVAVLTHLHGEELGWLCLGSCAVDVIVNAVAIFWVTRGAGDSELNTSAEAESHHGPAVVVQGISSSKGVRGLFQDHTRSHVEEFPLQVSVTTERHTKISGVVDKIKDIESSSSEYDRQ